MTLFEIVICVLYVAALSLAAWWLSRDLPDTCHCDEAEQGRACRGCTPPHLPRGK